MLIFDVFQKMGSLIPTIYIYIHIYIYTKSNSVRVAKKNRYVDKNDS